MQQKFQVQGFTYKGDSCLEREKYPCPKCFSTFTRKNNLYNHLKFQCGRLPRFACPHCNYMTKHASNVRTHVRRIHPDSAVYVVDINAQQTNSQSYGQYMFLGEGEQTEIVWESINISDENMEGIVNNCNNEIINKQHERTERKIKKFETNARHGQVKYLTRSRFRMPERTTKNKNIFNCPNNCGSSFIQKITLDRHLKFTCGQPLRYRCPYCDMSSRIRNCINIHVKARHPNLKNYVIDMSTTKTEIQFEEDFNSPIIQKVEPIWNEEQEIKILNVSSLATMDIKHEYDTSNDDYDDNSFNNISQRKRHVCPNNCGNSYKHEHTLKVHLQFGCNRNDQNFHLDDDESDSDYDIPTDILKLKNPEELLNPMAIGDNYQQNSEGKWVCPNKCGVTFSSRSNLTYHLKTNCGLKPKLECPYCLHRTKQLYNGFSHVKNSHPGAEICLIHIDTGEVLKSKKDSSQFNIGSLELKKSPRKTTPTCQTCGKEFKLEHTLSRHLIEGCGYPPRFKCPYCDYQVRRLSYAFFHVSKHHPGCEVYMVDLVTGDSITDPAQIKKEAIADIVDDEKPFDSSVNLQQQPKKTVKVGLQKKKVACPHGCGQLFFFKASLIKHAKRCKRNRKQSSTGRYKCPYCQNRYGHTSSLFRHIRASHSTKKKYFIDTYEEEIIPENVETINKKENIKAKKLPNDLDEKTDATENNDTLKTFVCPNKCGSSFEHFCNIQRHIRLNCAKARRYKCPQCNYRSQKFILIAKHIKTNHKMNRIYAIDYFTKKQVHSEQKHRPNKRGKTEENENIAEQLPKPTTTTTAKKTKTKKPFPCPNNCGRSFGNERAIVPHMRLVCGKNTMYKCPYCPQTCQRRGNMTIHIKHRHSGKKNYMIDISKKKNTRVMKIKKELQLPIVKIKEENEEEKPKSVAPSIFGNPVKRKTPRLFNCTKRRLMCPHKCGSYFSSSVKLKLHMSTACKKPMSTKCPYCHKQCKFAWNIDMHIKHRHPEKLDKNHLKDEKEIKNQNQDEMEEEIESKLTENMEEELNTSDKNEDVEMQSIEEEIKVKKENIEENTTIESNSPMKKFICPNKCGKSYPKESSLKNHLFFTCQKPLRYACPYCQLCSKVTSNGYVHVKRMHPDRRVYLIDIETNKIVCGSKYKPNTSDEMENKEISIDKTNNDSMEIVNDSNVDLDVDEPDEPDEPILGADEEFTNDDRNLVLEQSSSSSSSSLLLDKKKEELFVCPNNCGSSFTHEHKLINHVRDQCGPPRYKCPYCFFITREPSNVYAHIKNKHPDERIYMIDTDMNQSCNEPDSPRGNDDN